MSSSNLSTDTLSSRIESGNAPLLLHVLSGEAFEEKRIPGSLHACVYEVAFIDKVTELIPDKTTSLVVYGLNATFGAAALALERLAAAGYENALVLEGGLDDWESEGYAVEGAGEAASMIPDGSYAVDPEQSVFRWTGRNLFNQHNGRIAFISGFLEMKAGQLASGEVALDMTKITCSDLKDENMQKMLVGHLGTDDFFSVPEFPQAGFKMTDIKSIQDATPGDHTVMIAGANQGPVGLFGGSARPARSV
ncbi:MAG: YceI family protein [Verrucomicrobia bacterium]|nr:YceI family protein [Verrucomicrobiota bacterium]